MLDVQQYHFVNQMQLIQLFVEFIKPDVEKFCQELETGAWRDCLFTTGKTQIGSITSAQRCQHVMTIGCSTLLSRQWYSPEITEKMNWSTALSSELLVWRWSVADDGGNFLQVDSRFSFSPLHCTHKISWSF